MQPTAQEKPAFNPGWNTKDEMKAISFMGSDEPRYSASSATGIMIPTIKQRKQKLTAWLETSTKRRWDKTVDVIKCHNHAVDLLASL